MSLVITKVINHKIILRNLKLHCESIIDLECIIVFEKKKIDYYVGEKLPNQ